MSEKPTTVKRPRARLIGGAIIVLAVAAVVVIAVIRPGGGGPGPEFVTADGDHLMLDGKPFYYASTNTYELMYGQPVTVDSYFKRMNDVGLNVLRTWAFYDVASQDGKGGVEIANKGTWFQYFDPATGHPGYNDGPTGLEKLDYVIASAKAHNVKLILPLVNNWTSFGGMDQYVQWAGLTWHDDFINNEKIKGWYKDWVNHLLNRVNTITGVKYKDDPTIMGWELANEMRCSSSGPYLSSANCNTMTIVPWADEMSTYVRSIDKNHLISFGSEGFLCTQTGGGDWLSNCSQSGDPVAITALPNISLHGIHLYPDLWNPTKPTDDLSAWGVWYIQQEAAIANDAKKPFYIGEFGWKDKSTRLQTFNLWLKTFYENGGDGTDFWMMQPTNPGFTPLDYDGFVVYCPGAVCQLVSNWNHHVQDGTDWNEFGPIGDSDVTSTLINQDVSFSVIANDMAFGDATLDPTTLDLDPATSGVQSSLVTDAGTFTAQDGIVTFSPTPDQMGTGQTQYTIADSTGRVTDPIKIAVVILEPTTGG